MLETVIVGLSMLVLVFGARFGLINCFAAETAYKLKMYCGVAADGNVRMVRWSEGTPYFNDEMAYITSKAARGRVAQSTHQNSPKTVFVREREDLHNWKRP